jgi:hypothetical protein
MNFTKYDINTGKITGVGGCPDNVLFLQAKEGEAVREGIANEKLEYIVNNELVSRLLMGVSIDTTTVTEGEVITITGVPIGADIWVDGEKYNLAVGETVLELTFDTEGKYIIKIISFPYQDWERMVTVI